MKFERTLDFNCVPDWAEHYINYRSLRRVIDQLISSQVNEVSRDNSSVSVVLAAQGETALEMPSGHMTTLEMSFDRLFREELQRVQEFYQAERTSIMSKFKAVQDVQQQDGENLQGLYLALNDLADYLQLNQTGFRRIIKKHDKHSPRSVVATLKPEVEAALPAAEGEKLRAALIQVENLYASVCCEGHLEEAQATLRALLRERLIIERASVWQDLVAMERKVMAVSINESVQEKGVVAAATAASTHDLSLGGTRMSKPFPVWLRSLDWVWLAKLLIVVAAFAGIAIFPIMSDPVMNRALAVAVAIVGLWATEAMPPFATAILAPFLVVSMRVMKDAETHRVYDPKTAAGILISGMFSKVIMMLLGGFSIAAAATKYGLARQVASRMLRMAGESHGRLIAIVMLLALLLSSLVSNVAAPVLCFSLLAPLLRALPTESPLGKQLVLAVAVASNIGGMTSPISSPQNMVTMQEIYKFTQEEISWLSWFVISIPTCLTSIAVCWAVLYYGMRASTKSKAAAVNPAIFYSSATPMHWGLKEIAIILATVLAIAGWMGGKVVDRYLGDCGVVAVIPMVIMFGFNILSKDDFNSFPWNVVMLAMGGSALGAAVRSSGLLKHIADILARDYLPKGSPYLQYALVSVFITIATCFVSHTVGAIIFSPVAGAIGQTIGLDATRQLMLATGLCCSAGMLMPVSSFPNIAACAQEDGAGRRIVSSSLFMKMGGICTIILGVIVITVSYAMMTLAF